MYKVNNKFKLTTDYIINNNNSNQLQYERQLMSKYPKNLQYDEIYYLEVAKYFKNIKNILDTKLICNDKSLDNKSLDNNKSSNINTQELQKYMTKELYNNNVFDATKCIVNSLFVTKFENNDINNNIKKYVHDLHRIGAESANGTAFSVDFYNSDMVKKSIWDAKQGFFIMKTVQDIKKNNDLLHELIVGLYGTNKLRQYIPNFAYIYGGFKCGPPIYDKNNQIIDWCKNTSNNSNNNVNYILYENINPSISIVKFLGECNANEFLNIFLQILYALDLAHKEVDFTHYDLHNENVLLRIPDANEPNKLYQIPYKTENGWEYITTKYIPTFIDFGMSHIYNNELKTNNNNGHFGTHGFENMSINANRSWIMYDVYKFLMFCLLNLYNISSKGNDKDLKNLNDIYGLMSYIYKFFNFEDDMLKMMIEQYDKGTFYSIPLTKDTEQFTIEKLIKYIKSNKSYNFDFINKNMNNTIKLLQCEDLCITKNGLYNKIIDKNKF
jgi:hypothetical protein